MQPNFLLLMIIVSISLTAGTFTLGVANTEIETNSLSVQTGEVLSSESGDNDSFEDIDSDDVDTDEDDNDEDDNDEDDNDEDDNDEDDNDEDDNDEDDNNEDDNNEDDNNEDDSVGKTLQSFVSELPFVDNEGSNSEDIVIILDSKSLPNSISTNVSLNIGDVEKTATDFKVGNDEAFQIENNGEETVDIKVTGELSEPISGGHVILIMDSGGDTRTLTLDQNQEVSSKVIKDIQPNEDISASVILSTEGARVGDNFGTGYRFERLN